MVRTVHGLRTAFLVSLLIHAGFATLVARAVDFGRARILFLDLDAGSQVELDGKPSGEVDPPSAIRTRTTPREKLSTPVRKPTPAVRQTSQASRPDPPANAGAAVIPPTSLATPEPVAPEPATPSAAAPLQRETVVPIQPQPQETTPAPPAPIAPVSPPVPPAGRTAEGSGIKSEGVTSRTDDASPVSTAQQSVIDLASPPPAWTSYVNHVRERIQAVLARAYPEDLRRENITGRVGFEFAIARDGSVTFAEVRTSSSHAAFDSAAIRAVRTAAPFPPLPQSGIPQIIFRGKVWFVLDQARKER